MTMGPFRGPVDGPQAPSLQLLAEIRYEIERLNEQFLLARAGVRPDYQDLPAPVINVAPAPVVFPDFPEPAAVDLYPILQALNGLKDELVRADGGNSAEFALIGELQGIRADLAKAEEIRLRSGSAASMFGGAQNDALTDKQLRATPVPVTVSGGGGSTTVTQGTNPWVTQVSNFPATQSVAGTVTANIGTTNGLALEGTDATGVTAPSGATGIRGWLSGIYQKLSGTISTSRTWTLGSGTDSVTTVPSGTQTVSAASLPLPTGAATAANQTGGNQKTQVVDATGAVNLNIDSSGAVALQSGGAPAATAPTRALQIGSKYSAATPSPVTDGQMVATWMDPFGRPNTAIHSAELNSSVSHTSLRDLQVAQRYTVLPDSIADGFQSSFWTLTSSGSGTVPTVNAGSGEGTLSPGGGASGYSQMVSTVVRYFPGQSSWLNTAIRFGDTGTVGNTRRIGVFTVSGTTPQDGFCFELIDTTFYASIYKAGTLISQTPAASWSRATASPFTLDTNYHSFEIRYTANGAQFYIDNVLRHLYTGTTAAITATLNFSITLQSVNTGGPGTSSNLYVRNVGIGRFGTPPAEYTSGQALTDQAGANAVLTFTFSSPVDMIWVTDIGSGTSNISRVDPFGGLPSSSAGIAVPNGTPTPIDVIPPSATVKVYAPTNSTIAIYGKRYV